MIFPRDLFRAYYDARKNKRNTINALAFEVDYEKKLFQLHREIISGNYRINHSACFITFKPIQREIFAADFRDRIVHRLIYNYINPTFEKLFINDSYSCRLNKGTSYGIKRLDYFIRSCSDNYRRDCYILKLDIKGYFMAIDKEILWGKMKKGLLRLLHPAGARNDANVGGRSRRPPFDSKAARGRPPQCRPCEPGALSNDGGGEAISSVIASPIRGEAILYQ